MQEKEEANAFCSPYLKTKTKVHTQTKGTWTLFMSETGQDK